MGEVYRARDQKLGRDVAIKLLPAAFAADTERLARFAREARVLAALNHPHIAAIYGVEDAGPVHALVLELVDGPTLADLIARGPIPVREALATARQIAEALEAAHEKGIVHRDLKPANVKVTPAGIAKVLDFGLAKAASDVVQAAALGAPTASAAYTRDGHLLGTPSYMSPEQARAQVVDKRADVWAFGCVLFEMLTGRMAFAGSTISDTLAAVLEREPDWNALPAATPAAVRRLLRKCLEKDAKRRVHDIADARIELEEETGPTAPTTPRRWRRSRATAAVMGVVLLAGLAAWAVSRLRPPTGDGTVLRLQLTLPERGRFGALVGEFQTLAVSPDGKTVVFGATVDGKTALWRRALDDTTLHALPGTQNARQPFWSPDGRSIAFIANGKLQRLDIAGGSPIVICDVPRVYGGAWAPDGRIILGVFADALFSVPASGGTLSPLTTFDKSRGDRVHAWPQVLPGGRFLYFVGTSVGKSAAIYAASLAKPNDAVRLVASDANALYASGPDGRGYLLWQRDGALVAQEFDVQKLMLVGEPRPLADPVGVLRADASMAVAAGGGTLLYAPVAGLVQLTRFDRAGRPLGTLGEPGVYFTLRFSRDGKQIATTRFDVGLPNLWLFDVDREPSPGRLFGSRAGFSALWSPDGRSMLFINNELNALYRRDASDGATAERLGPWPTEDWPLTDWSRDGRFVLNTRAGTETRADLWLIPVTFDGHLMADVQAIPYLRTPANESEGRFSPDPTARWIAHQSDESGRDEVYVRSFPEPGSRYRVSSSGGRAPRWGSDGRELFYQSLDDKVMAVSVKLGADSVEASEPRELFALPAQSVFEVTPDGQRFLALVRDHAPRPLNVIHNWPLLLSRRAATP
jgi:Tol biopolymer transport system component